ncbi:MAG TPA: type II toxin-antitoxin system HicA family toxin [Candidatus Paceibacterota bacterium]|nr:type II toxin-antitoxin system HicA family toxin [Candidatus Paceibacterota bacterium]
MPKLPSSKAIVSVLLKEGFVFVSQKGSHAKYRNSMGGRMMTVIVPMGQKEIPWGTVRSIIHQSGLPRERFVLQ